TGQESPEGRGKGEGRGKSQNAETSGSLNFRETRLLKKRSGHQAAFSLGMMTPVLEKRTARGRVRSNCPSTIVTTARIGIPRNMPGMPQSIPHIARLLMMK